MNDNKTENLKTTTGGKKTVGNKKTDPQTDNTEEDFLAKRTFWDRIPKYRWWVTPLNILFICLFLIIVDVVSGANTAWMHIDWAWWPIAGIWFVYAISFILFKRPEIAWMVGPLLMVGISVLLFTIDFVLPPNAGPLGLDWAIIPIAALLVFGALIPILTKFGRKKEKPIEKFRRALAEMKKEEGKEEKEEKEEENKQQDSGKKG